MDHLLTVAFDTRDAARSALARLQRDGAGAGSALEDACAASRALDGTLDVVVSDDVQALGADFWQRLVRGLTLDDAEAGLPKDFAEHVAASLQPGRSAILALTNGADVDPLVAKLAPDGRPLRCELGDGGREELRRRIESLPDDARAADSMAWQAGFGSFQ